MTEAARDSGEGARPSPVPASSRRWTTTLFTAALATFSIVLSVLAVPDRGPLSTVQMAVALGLGIGFALADIMPLHLESRGQTFSVSLSELLLVVGLFFCPLDLLIAGRVIGGGLALKFHRRQPLEKLAFNVSLQLFEATTAVAVFVSLPVWRGADGFGAGLEAAGAVTCSSLASILVLTVMVRVRTGSWTSAVRAGVTNAGLVNVIAGCSTGLVLVAAVQDTPMVLAPLVVVFVTMGFIYRAHVDLRHRHANLEMIHEFSQSTDRFSTNEERVRALLTQTREVLRCQRAEIVLLPADGDDELMRRWVDDEGPLESQRFRQRPSDWPLARVITDAEQILIARETRESGYRQFLNDHGLRDCILAPLRSENGPIGVIMVANRQSDVTTFTAEDSRLFRTVAGQVGRALENGRLLDRLTYDSQHDALTGLANRSCYQGRIATALAHHATAHLAVMIMDLDRFKEVNDTLGHHHGDLLIREVARRLNGAVPSEATVARLGGDEFAILLPGATAVTAAGVASQVLAAVGRPCSLDGVLIDVEASIGVAVAPADGQDESGLLKRADMAMYAAKTNGTGVEFYNSERDEYSPRRLALASRIRSAVAADEMTLHYQPQVDARTGKAVAVEALMRWQHPEYGIVSPAEFIPIAEQSGAIGPLSAWALSTAIAQLADWRKAGLELEIAVNLSMRNLLDAGIVQLVSDLLREHAVPGELLTLEVTESCLMMDPTRTLPLLHRLARLGVRLSIDDFGTGYSSLAYLKQLPVHEIKIDRSFMTSIAENDQDIAIVRAVTELAHSLGVDVVAEGVEDDATLDRVVALGCDRIQGYLFSRPMAADAMPGWLDSHEPKPAPEVEQTHPRRNLSLAR